jgi:hypothetical protein
MWLVSVSTLSVLDDDYYRKTSCALNLIFTPFILSSSFGVNKSCSLGLMPMQTVSHYNTKGMFLIKSLRGKGLLFCLVYNLMWTFNIFKPRSCRKFFKKYIIPILCNIIVCLVYCNNMKYMYILDFFSNVFVEKVCYFVLFIIWCEHLDNN